MAIAITSQPDYLQPVKSVQEFTLYDSANFAEAGFYYQLDVSIAGETRTLKTLKDSTNKSTIDVQTILQAFFESEFRTYEDTSTNLWISYPDFIQDYQVRASSVWTTSSSVGSWITAKKVFNGVDRYNNTWDASLYEFRTDSSGLWLTSDHSDRDIHLEDRSYLFGIFGANGSVDSSFNGITFVRYQNNGDTSTYTWPQSIASASPIPFTVQVDPSIINYRNGSEFISADTNYFTVTESTGLSETIRYNLVTEDSRYDRYYRIQYVDSLGATCAFNFDLVPENNIGISKTTYVNDRTLRTFGTKVNDNYVARCNWICDAKSKALKDLWHTPKAGLVKETYGTEPDPIIITETSKAILNRHNVGLINYTINFTMADEYSVQEQ